MYTLCGTFEEIVAFLEGYYSGMAKANPYAPPVVEWSAFRAWLAEKLNLSTEEIFLQFRDRYGESSTALHKMAERYTEFLNENS
jgi:hypothetical protein